MSEKMHASPAEQKPLQSGASASPHETLRHSHDPVPTAEPHFDPAAHVPVHRPFENRHPATVVVVVPAPGTVVVVTARLWLARTQRSFAARNVTRRLPKVSVNCARAGTGRVQVAG